MLLTSSGRSVMQEPYASNGLLFVNLQGFGVIWSLAVTGRLLPAETEHAVAHTRHQALKQSSSFTISMRMYRST